MIIAYRLNVVNIRDSIYPRNEKVKPVSHSPAGGAGEGAAEHLAREEVPSL